MAENYDDILFAQDEPAPEERQSPGYDPEAYKELKQQQRDAIYAMIDETALTLAAPEKLKEYLDIQSRFDLYRPGNVLLIQAQMPTASRLKTYEEWQKVGAGVRKNPQSCYILKSGRQYTRDDGSIGQFTDIKKVFDISQTYNAPKSKQYPHPEGRTLLKALMNKSPVLAKAADILPEGMGAYYDPQNKVILVRPGMDAPDIFRCLSNELAVAELHRSMGEDFSRDNAAFPAYCASYVLCRENGVDVSSFNFENAAQEFSGKDAKDIRADLGNIRDAAGEIGGRVRQALQQERNKQEPEQGDR
ncbi:MAG: ssDNA-binding domain-containing protein [Oscillospiraceae bacterium]|jgi:hypothetical protein|nr:ssDNA-binding domain-containing protein [Oscillospiraceae bacterium]